jgi:type II secretory pathway pseudopilin PulG
MRKPIARLTNRKRESGYILLTILFWVSVMSITVALPMLAYFHQQMKRDQEEELVHRGVEYERAIRKYYRKFGSYPPTIEALEDSNHMRFLRRRYKDPITGKDFKLLHQMDVMAAFGNALGGGNIAGGQTLGQSVSSMNGPAPSTDSNANPSDSSTPTTAQSSGAASTGDQPQSTQQPNSGSTLPFAPISGQSGVTQTLGGGGIAGVASISPDQSIRVYAKKDHYKDWLFAYNPAGDRGGLPRGPYDPAQALANQMLMQGMQNGMNGINGQNGLNQPFGQNGTGSGQNSGFGQNNGFGQNGMGLNNGRRQ